MIHRADGGGQLCWTAAAAAASDSNLGVIVLISGEHAKLLTVLSDLCFTLSPVTWSAQRRPV